MDSMAKSPDVHIPGFCTPLRSKELLERHRSTRCTPKKGYLTPQNGQRTKPPNLQNASIPSIFITDGDTGLERPNQLLQRLERSINRSSSASRIPPKNAFLSTQNRQRALERPKTLEFRWSKKAITFSEPRPLRSKELLGDLKSLHKVTSATKATSQSNLKNQDLLKTREKRCTFIPSSEPQPIRPKVILERERQEAINNRLVLASIDRPRTKRPTTSFSSSKLLVPQIGFSYPKDPKSLHTASKATKLTNSKRKLDFHTELGKDSLRLKLDKMAKEWQKKSEYQLRQFISDFLKQLVRLLPFNGVQFSHLSRNSYVEQTMEALQQLQYSKEVNRSWFRTTNTPEAMGHVLEILNFLLDIVENRKGEGMCMFPIASEDQPIPKQRQGAKEPRNPKVEQALVVHNTTNDIISLEQKLNNLKIEKEELDSCEGIPISTNDLDKIMDRVGNRDVARLLDAQEENLHKLQLHRLRLQEFSELVTLAKLKLKRCQEGNKESIEAFNEQILDLADSLVFRNRHISCLSQLHLGLNPTIEDIQERMEQLQRLYEDNYLNLQQIKI
ncbi:kinetochore and Eb1-associated basic protein [Drosophila subpulchrella]|uniref:kinetochore and Eb1-associated basic protein n=1 Tax=Drosophila subpulchrella TaxID=1486046 RepID=UPI0018A15D9E|nr:kinetochore and Eb1-associated basic protein [Drosophila subpulchrella]XP_037708697.1 kinetochore and Eb1-associated basic protein [Drosophila subpulchrella]